MSIEKSSDFVNIGKLVPFKLIELSVEAFALIADEYKNVKYHIVGSGPCKKRIESIIKTYCLENRVIMHGKVDRKRALDILAASNCYLTTSAREGGSWVWFEGMMCKKPVICFDTSGMSIIVSNDTGIKIPIMDYEKAKYAFAEKMKYILQNSDISMTLGNNGCRRVMDEFLWEKKGNVINNIIDNSESR